MASEAHADFEKAHAALENFEGGHANSPYDKGGETYKGISRKFWPNWQGWPIIDAAKVHSSFAEGARSFSKHLAQIDGLNDLVKQYYFDVWWSPLQFCALPDKIAAEIFEQSVNLGRSSSCRYLQKLCNAMNYYDGERIFEKDLSRLVLLLFVLTLLVSGCVNLGENQPLPAMPTTPNAIVGDEYICIPLDEAAELLLWMKYAEEQCN